jgi:hypothetical protein
MMEPYPIIDFSELYKCFDLPVCEVNCGEICAVHNPSGKPFCCDICQAVPAVYHPEWAYLQRSTKLWQEWIGDECGQADDEAAAIRENTPDSMQLLACQGPAYCQRTFRALSCRQFPFFPYLTEDYCFIGLAYEWHFEPSCWVISHLDQVTPAYRQAFIATFDHLFDLWPQEMDNYAALSAEMREEFIFQQRRIPILHRNGNNYLLNSVSEHLRLADLSKLPKYGCYFHAQHI